ncbi:MAG TPA: family 65 glycosyl hydrolase, partial [Candidatus Dormibacteraeota bacterium]|nr:family 65 glycosyl hydrolase [Candidatus Dormibacteraeota bacterium]
MIPEGYFPVEPWAVREPRLDANLLGQSESIFALSNGHIGWRANLEEGEPHEILGSYLNAVYEEVPLPVAETAYGYPEAGQTIINVADGKIIRLLVDDEPFDIRYGTVIEHERVLDLKAGLLRRTVVWESPAHRRVRIRTTRLVSLVHRALAAIRYEVEPVDGGADLVVQSELVANEPVTGRHREDPRSATVVDRPFQEEFRDTTERGAVLIHSTRKSKLRVAAAMDHEVRGPKRLDASSEVHEDLARFTVAAPVK